MRSLLRTIDASILRTGAIVAVLWLGFGVTVEAFTSGVGFSTLLGRSVTDGLLVIGLTVCLLGGQIDLSIGSTLALSGVLFALTQPQWGLAAGAAVGITAGIAVGFLNAFLVTRLRVDSFISTLGTLLAVRATALVVSDSGPVAGTDLDAALFMNDPLVGPFSPRVAILVAVLVPVWALIRYTVWGRELVATGGDRAAAEASGVPSSRRLTMAFVLSGFCAGVAGVQQAISLLSASPIVGDTNLLTAAAAAFLGGVALTGGRGNAVAAVLAVVALSSISTGLELALVRSAYQQIVVGVLIVAMGVIATGTTRKPLGSIRNPLSRRRE